MRGHAVIHAIFLDSIGLALFSLAWWGWLIGGGLAVVGMLFGVHVAVGAPEARADGSANWANQSLAYEPGHPLYSSGPSKYVQMADALSSGDTDRYLELKGDTQAQLGNALSSGDIGAGASYAQQMQQESGGTSSGTSSSSSSASSGSGSSGGYSAPDGSTWVSKAAYDDFHRDYDAEYAQWQKDMAAWEAQYGGGGGGGGSAPAAPGPSPSSGAAVGNNPWMADPYYDVESQWSIDLMSTYFQSGDNGARLDADREAAKRHYDSDKPLVMKVGTWDSQTFTDRSYALVSPQGVLDETGAQALAKELVPGEIARAGSAEAALELAKDFNSSYQIFFDSYRESGDLSFTERNDVHEYMAKAAVTKYLVVELEQAVIDAAAPPAVATVAFKAKGAQVDPTYTPSDDGGTLDIAMKAKARAGSTVKIQVMEYKADKGRMVVVDTTKAKVGKGGKIHTAVEADAGDVIMVKKNTGKKLAQIEIPGQ